MYIVTEVFDRELCSQFMTNIKEKATEMAEKMFIAQLRDWGYSDEVIEEYASHYVDEDEWNCNEFGYEIYDDSFTCSANFWINYKDFNYDVYVNEV